MRLEACFQQVFRRRLPQFQLSQAGAFASTQSSTQTHSIPSVSHPRLVIQDDNGTVHIHTGSSGSGEVEVDDVTGQVKVETGSGSISLQKN